MVQNFADLPSVKAEMTVGEVDEGDAGAENDQPGVVSLTLGLKRIISKFVPIRLVMDVLFLLPGVSMGIA